jgi:hypothetical protein
MGMFIFLDHVESLLGKLFRGQLVVKIRKAIADRALSVASHLISAIAESSPKNSALRKIDMVQREITKGIHYYLQNSKSAKHTALSKMLAEGLVHGGFQWALLGIYTAKTQPLVTTGLEKAQTMARSTLDPATALEKNKQVETRVTNILALVDGSLDALERDNSEVRVAQSYAKIVTDFSDVGTLVTSATGVGNVVSGLLQLLAILSRCVDGAMSVNMATRAGQTIEDITSAASQLTNESFAMNQVFQISGEGLVIDDLPVPERAVLSPHMSRALGEMFQASDDYTTILRDLSAGLRAKDRAKIEMLLDRLADTDDALARKTTIARAPIYAGAAALIRRADFATSFSAMNRNGAQFDLADLALYLSIVRAVDNLENVANLQAALDQIDKTLIALDQTNRSIQDLLPVVASVVKEPYLIVAGHSAPSLVVAGQEFELTVRVHNAGIAPATAAMVELGLPQNVQGVSGSRITLGDLAPGAQVQATFKLRWLQADQAVVQIIPSSTNGAGMSLMIILRGQGTTGPFGGSPTLQGEGTVGVVVLFLVLLIIGSAGIAGAVAYATSNQAGAALLIILGGRSSRASCRLSRGETRLGRDRTNDLVLAFDDQISRHHAVIRREPSGYVLYDLRSHNGTFVNGQTVSRHILHHGDQVRLGNTVLIFQNPGYK